MTYGSLFQKLEVIMSNLSDQKHTENLFIKESRNSNLTFSASLTPRCALLLSVRGAHNSDLTPHVCRLDQPVGLADPSRYHQVFCATMVSGVLSSILVIYRMRMSCGNECENNSRRRFCKKRITILSTIGAGCCRSQVPYSDY